MSDIRTFFLPSTGKINDIQKNKITNTLTLSKNKENATNTRKRKHFSTCTIKSGKDLPSQTENIPPEEKEIGCIFDTMESMIHSSWAEVLQDEFSKPYFHQLKNFLESELKKKAIIYPRLDQIFAALNHCTLDKLKVVILGQDPYHGPNQAHGLCFSVQRGVQPPPSLKNIYKEAHIDIGIQIPRHGCLTSWSDQGVLLLNTVLTVRKSEPNSHKKQGWEMFTDKIISYINDHTDGVVFLLWGKPAHEKGNIINTKKHLVIKSSHPSPLGATKTNAPFIGSKCFSLTNNYLQKNGKEPIDWNLPQ